METAPYVLKQVQLSAKIVLGLAVLALGGATFFAVDLALGHRPTFERCGGGLALAAFGLWHLVGSVRKLRNPSRHEVIQELSRHGPLPEVCREIERIATSPGGFRLTELIFADGWIVMPGFGLSVIRWSEIAWAYEKELTVKKSGVQVAKLRDVVIHTSAGPYSGSRPFQYPVLASQVPEALAKIREIAPQAVIGFDEEAKKLWEKDREAALHRLRSLPTKNVA